MMRGFRFFRGSWTTVLPLLMFMCVPSLFGQRLPSKFDLRDVNGQNYVTSVKSQQGGTCWTHGVMAAIEGNLLMTGNWAAAGETGEPNLAEYHLDWWNGFNQHNNDDKVPPSGGGLTVHQGGDYLVAEAYLSRNEGAVRDVDGQSYNDPPPRSDPSFHYYYPRHIEWYTAGPDLSNIDTIKQAIMEYGVLGTCMCYSSSYMQNYIHYQPPSSSEPPNHAVAIIGWDDDKPTQAPHPGAWLVKNSWGSGWGYGGYFWISYYDKHCCQNDFMGAVSFQDVEPLAYDHTYYHDYHGWRDTLDTASEAFNAFLAVGPNQGMELLKSVSFCTAEENVSFTVKIYDRFENGQLLDLLSEQSGSFEHRGFHTVDLDAPVTLVPGDDFYVYLYLSKGGQAFDRTSDVPVLLGASYRVTVVSASNPGESFYKEGGVWKDLYDYNDTANFCIKGLSVDVEPLKYDFPDGLPGVLPPGPETHMTVKIESGSQHYVPGTGTLYYRFDPAGAFQPVPLTPLGGDLFEAVLPNTRPGDEPQFYFSAQGDGGSTVLSPPGAPNDTYAFEVCFVEKVFEDDFETDKGWTVFNDPSLQTGPFERADPEGTDAQPEDDHTPGGTRCYVTGHLGGGIGDHDVDGGPTILTSPEFDLSGGGEAWISCYVWFYHSDNGTFQPLRIQLSNDGGSTWTLVEDMGHSPAWNFRSIKVSDFVSPTAQVQIRFRAIDNPNDSVVEALVDDFKVERHIYEAALWADAYTASCAAGAQVTFSMDAGVANAGRNYLLLGTLSGTEPGFTLPGGHSVPINWDAFTNLVLSNLNISVFLDFMGTLDGNGRASAIFDTLGSVDPVLAGSTMSFAYILGLPPAWDFASNPVNLLFEP